MWGESLTHHLGGQFIVMRDDAQCARVASPSNSPDVKVGNPRFTFATTALDYLTNFFDDRVIHFAV